MAREATFTFVPAHQIERSDKDRNILGRATISIEHGQLYLKKEYAISNSVEGKFIRFYLDLGKKAIAWKFFEEGSLEDLSEYKRVVIQKSGQCLISIGKVLTKMKLSKEKEYDLKKLEIKSYKTPGAYLSKDNDFHYITLREKETDKNI